MIRGTRIRQGILGSGLVVSIGWYAVAYCAPEGSIGEKAGADSSSSSAGKTGSPSQNDLVVHEWGTFLAMSGSDGTTLDGMYHDEHALPDFVHAQPRPAPAPLERLERGNAELSISTRSSGRMSGSAWRSRRVSGRNGTPRPRGSIRRWRWTPRAWNIQPRPHLLACRADSRPGKRRRSRCSRGGNRAPADEPGPIVEPRPRSGRRVRQDGGHHKDAAAAGVREVPVLSRAR